MSNEYGTHVDYMNWVGNDAEKRQKAVETALQEAFSNFIEKREVDVIVFLSMTALDLAKAIISNPIILKPLLAACNVAARAIERDLSIKNVDTYNPRLSADQVKVIAGYIKPFLPPYLEIPALSNIDRIAFIDKEIRKGKGRWEKKIVEGLNKFSNIRFYKRMFSVEGEKFELDAATPKMGDIKIGIDIKRIEARRDIHKRCDEIVNKGAKLKIAFPDSKFGAVVYYPFIDEHINIQNRLHSDNIDKVIFASESTESIESAVKMLLSIFGVLRK
ncbi:hypothetical protein CH333_05335 [candidate division WOR-3 bacterium JGI_Cruoil_03_44_89]|uniref:Uncharacterized protein n=1 Tax=candidate division WOR-3 bacterium JGI_Cruoil_03_44_89 TaxID=1973748 RepID=A0A235BTF5_UNCW3|nr:MAG: hypothetical protein CH333_05335 [candidate division WOR-3 bacterium JGI_Cruoil_03_44_89]